MRKLLIFLVCFFIIPLFTTLAAFSFANAQSSQDVRASIINKLGSELKKFSLLEKSDYKRIKKINANKFVIPKDLRVKALLSLPKVTEQAKVIKTVTRAGKPGYLVTFMERDSVFRKLGLVVGDVLTKINGAELSDAKQVSSVFSNTIKIDNINLEVLRDLKKVVLSYQFI